MKVVFFEYWVGLLVRLYLFQRKSAKSIVMQIERRRLTDQIVDQLIAMIVSGKLRRGDKLSPEHTLMKQFGVGRSTLREAIGALSLTGVLTVRPGYGTHVTVSPEEFLAKPLSWGLLMTGRDKVRELIEARIALEKAIVGLAAERATEEDIAEIRYHQAQLKATKKTGLRSIQADLSFHTALAKASHNAVLMRFLSELRHLMRSWMEQGQRAMGGYNSIREQHDEILYAIEVHDVERAQSALCKHLESVGDKLASILLERQL